MRPGRRSGRTTAISGLDPLRPIAECVEVGPDGGFLAHFGYDNPNKQTVSSPPENVFQPFTANGQQPTSFLPGSHADVFQVGLQSGEPDLAPDRQPGDRDAPTRRAARGRSRSSRC